MIHELPPSLRIGVPSIDKEHLDLVRLLDRLTHDTRTNIGPVEFSEIFSRLGGLMVEHFASEERIFKACGMPLADVKSHVSAHRKILRQYVQLNSHLLENDAHTFADTAEAVKEWIIDHLLEHDVKIREYVGASLQE